MKLSEGTKRKLFVLSFALWCVDAGLYLLSFFWTQMYRWGALLSCRCSWVYSPCLLW